jgi:hypothetical protein
MPSTCSLLYYPGQDLKFGCMVGHADLEFEGIVYTFGCGLPSGCHSQSEVDLNRRIKKAKNGGLPFERFSFQLTKAQSNRLREILTSQKEPFLCDFDDSTRNAIKNCLKKLFRERIGRILDRTIKNSMIPFGLSCMHSVSKVLQKADILEIPQIIKLSPLLSSTYLHTISFWGNKKVKDITYYGNTFSSVGNFFTVNSCRLGEIGSLVFPIFTSTYILYSSYLNNLSFGFLP